jgi:putative ABC transport system permease protein
LARPRPLRINPLWRKAPLVLVHFPGLLASLAAGALLLALAVAAYPLFISARTTDLVTVAISNPLVTRAGAGIEYRIDNLPLVHSRYPSPGLIGQRFSETMNEQPLLGPTVVGILGPEVSISLPGRGPVGVPGRLFAGTRTGDHVRVLAGGEANGARITDLTASELGVKPGGEISLSFEGMRPVNLRVAAIYRALYVEPRTAYWHRWDVDIYQRCQTCDPPPPFVLVSPRQLVELSKRLGSRVATFSWQAPVASGPTLTLDDALVLERFTNQFRTEISDPENALSRIFPCCHAPLFAGAVTTSLSSSIANVIADAGRKIATLEQPGRLLQIAGIIVALVVIAAAAAFALSARRVEAQLLFARGASPAWVAAKGCLESILPAALGGAAGLGLAFALVRAVDPHETDASSAIRAAIQGASLAVAASIGLLGIVTAVSFLRRSPTGRNRFGRLAHLPWELVLLALAAYFLRRLEAGGAFATDRSLGVRRPSIYLLLFPVVSLAGLAVVGARLFGVALRWVRDRSGRLGSWLYLAVHRLAGASKLTLMLIAASALSLGIFVQAQTIVRSLETTVDAKAQLFVGSDVEGRVLYETPQPPSFPLPLTRVTRLPNAGTLADGSSFDVLAVDPSTIAAVAYWQPAFSDRSIQRIAQDLRGSTSGPVPIVVAGRDVTPTSLVIDGVRFPVRVVGHATAFPGMSSLNPLVVVDATALLDRFTKGFNPLNVPEASTEFWVKGDPTPARAALQATTYPPYLLLTANEVKDIPEIAAAIDTFVVLNALGLAAALLVVAGMLMYLQARQRSQVLSYALSLRMGMTHSHHRRSLVVELGTMLCYAYLLGLALAVGAALVMVPKLDPLATIPPSPLFIWPRLVFASALAAVIAVAWAGGWLTNRRAHAADFGQFMRLGE